jgi:hypothetical protein
VPGRIKGVSHLFLDKNLSRNLVPGTFPDQKAALEDVYELLSRIINEKIQGLDEKI